MSIVCKTTETMAQVHSFVPAGKGLDTHFATLTIDKRDKTTKIIMCMVKLLGEKRMKTHVTTERRVTMMMSGEQCLPCSTLQ